MKRFILCLCIFLVSSLGYADTLIANDAHEYFLNDAQPLPEHNDAVGFTVMTIEEELELANEIYNHYMALLSRLRLDTIASDRSLSNEQLLRLLGVDPDSFEVFDREYLQRLSNDELCQLFASRRDLERLLSERYGTSVRTLLLSELIDMFGINYRDEFRNGFYDILTGVRSFDNWLSAIRYDIYLYPSGALMHLRNNLGTAMYVKGLIPSFEMIDSLIPHLIGQVYEYYDYVQQYKEIEPFTLVTRVRTFDHFIRTAWNGNRYWFLTELSATVRRNPYANPEPYFASLGRSASFWYSPFNPTAYRASHDARPQPRTSLCRTRAYVYVTGSILRVPDNVFIQALPRNVIFRANTWH